jgi:phospholipid-binding lipoprotein MlaA
MAGMAKLKQGMTIKIDDVMTDQRAMRFGLLIIIALMWLPGCAGRTGSATVPAAMPEPPAPAVLLADASATEAPAADVTEQASDEPFDPFAKSGEEGIEEYDPWEPFNVKMFEFNRQVDRWVLKPVAKGYNFVMPNAAQIGISNLFYNLRFPQRFFNNMFQGKAKGAGIEIGRFLVNTTVGVGGLFDVAQHLDLKTPEEDTGQTFGFYGMKPGPYLVLPLLPPFSLRDFTGFLGDMALNPINWLVAPIIEVEGIPSVIGHTDRMTSTLVQLGARAGEMVNQRSLNLEKFQGVEEATLDLYAAVRNAYLQQRARAIRE